jgi:hypothetical protein
LENPYFIQISQMYKELYLKTNMQVILLPATLNRHKSPLGTKFYQAVGYSVGGRNIMRTRHSVMLHVYFLRCTYFIQDTKIILNKSILVRFEHTVHNM